MRCVSLDLVVGHEPRVSAACFVFLSLLKRCDEGRCWRGGGGGRQCRPLFGRSVVAR